MLEVLVALAILAIAMSAVIKVTSENAENAGYLRDKTLAHWVAMNVITEIQVQGKWPKIGIKKGVVKMAEHKWYWLLEISTTVDNELRRLEVKVYLNKEEEALTTLIGFVAL
ncbi:type II secretion system minor pseudopilin GspI [Candidatus Halobeggiatoa sp. HSG11]|nr:type II secretion system minor pseudopilin GspI [Candidatus Halobeggiatoa sp. HSG11]